MTKLTLPEKVTNGSEKDCLINVYGQWQDEYFNNSHPLTEGSLEVLKLVIGYYQKQQKPITHHELLDSYSKSAQSLAAVTTGTQGLVTKGLLIQSKRIPGDKHYVDSKVEKANLIYLPLGFAGVGFIVRGALSNFLRSVVVVHKKDFFSIFVDFIYENYPAYQTFLSPELFTEESVLDIVLEMPEISFEEEILCAPYNLLKKYFKGNPSDLYILVVIALESIYCKYEQLCSDNDNPQHSDRIRVRIAKVLMKMFPIVFSNEVSTKLTVDEYLNSVNLNREWVLPYSADESQIQGLVETVLSVDAEGGVEGYSEISIGLGQSFVTDGTSVYLVMKSPTHVSASSDVPGISFIESETSVIEFHQGILKVLLESTGVEEMRLKLDITLEEFLTKINS